MSIQDDLEAEIERLRDQKNVMKADADAEIERLRTALDASADYGDKQIAEIKRLRAENLDLIHQSSLGEQENERLRILNAKLLAELLELRSVMAAIAKAEKP